MKTLFSLSLLALGAAHAQRPFMGIGSKDDRRPAFDRRVEGRYVSLQRDDTILRTLRLDRDGTAEVVTEFRRPKLDRIPRNGGFRLNDRDIETFGRSAGEAADRGRPFRQAGRWTLRDDRLVFRFEGFGGSSRGGDEMRLDRRGDTMVFDLDTDLYGRQRIVFYRDQDNDRSPGRPQDGRRGGVLLDRAYYPIEDMNYTEGRGGARLAFWVKGRRYELSGRPQRTEDGVTLRVDGNRGRDFGLFTIRLRGPEVVSVSGSGQVDGTPVAFAEGVRQRGA